MQVQAQVAALSVEGSEIQVLTYPGSGASIVLLHATGFMPRLWHPIARELSPTYSVLAPFFCDHRSGEPEDGGIRWQLLAEDLTQLCLLLGIDRPIFIGHSMGATVATLAAAGGRLSPRAMVLIEPIFLPEEFYAMNIRLEQHPLASKSIKRRNQWSDLTEARQYLRSKKLFEKWDDEVLELYLQHGLVAQESAGLQLVCSPRREAALFMGGTAANPWPLLPHILCPVLLLEGEESENRSYIDLKKAASLFPQGGYQLVENAGHLIPMEKPALLTKILRGFLIEQGV